MCQHPWHHWPYNYGYYPFWGSFWLGWDNWWYWDYAYWAYPRPCDVPDYCCRFVLYSQPEEEAPEQTATAAEMVPSPTESSDLAAEFLTQAVAAFRSGQYAQAVRLGNHAAVEAP